MINQESSPEDLAAIDAALQQSDIPFDAELIRAWADLQDTPSYVTRFARGKNRIVERLKRGETVEVKVMSNGREFAIRPERWEGLILGFSCLIDGKVEPGYEGMMLEKDRLWDWTNDLIERA